MYRRTRRKSTGVWFPTQPSPPLTTNLVTTAAALNSVALVTQPIIADGYDAPANEVTLAGGTAASLALTLNRGYLVKRIVGQCFARSVDGVTGLQRLAFFGIFTDRVDASGTLLNVTAWNPFKEDSIRKRWLFRRSWILEGSGAAAGPAPYYANWHYGDVRSGAHIDCKAKARITYEERLFMIFALTNIASAAAVAVRFDPQLRLFAQPFSGGSR
jgi:hypothetical protein